MPADMNCVRIAGLLLLTAVPALVSNAQTGLPILSRPIGAQVLNRGSVQIDLRNHFGVPGVTGQIVQFNTTLGRVNVELLTAEAPQNVANFLGYVAKTSYDNTLIHRIDPLNAVVPSIIHGGGYPAVALPPAPTAILRNPPVPLEYRVPHTRGTLAAYHAPNEPDGATSEWFFNLLDNSAALGPTTDGGYTVFGRVIGTGLTVLEQIAQVPTFSVGGTPFSRFPLRNFSATLTQLTSANFVTVNSVRVVPIYPASLGDPTAVLSFAVTPPNNAGIITTSISGSTLTLTPLAVGSVTIAVRAVDSNGNASLATTFSVNVPAESLLAPVFTSHPVSQTVALGGTVVLNAAAAGGDTNLFPLTYQWFRNGFPIAAPSSRYLVLRGVAAGDAGDYTCRATNAIGPTISLPATVTVVPATALETGRLVNLAIRTEAGALDEALIIGFAVGDNRTSGNKPLLVRGIGPSLAQFGVRNAMPDPVLEVYRGAERIAENDNWSGNTEIAVRTSQVGAFAFSGALSLDSAAAITSAVGSYTVQLRDKSAGAGTVLAEVYDASPSAQIGERTPRLVNLSARARVEAEGGILTAGFVIGGTTPATVLVRAAGPALAGFGVEDVLADPRLQLYRGTTLLNENDDWDGEAQVAALAGSVGAFALPGGGSKDAVMLVTLSPGAYTVQVSDPANRGGVVLIEAYEIR
jgi:cyclophilin family peptidyl-prolyl cis-trans isomerase